MTRPADYDAPAEYRWLNEYDLAGQNNAWLRSACRERGIRASKMNRAQMKQALLASEGHVTPPAQCPHCGTRPAQGEPCPLCGVIPPAEGE